jgi:sugar phosphate isomerase/epimerase
MDPKYRIAAITDEYSPDLAIALKAMAETGMTGAELRVISGKNIINLTDEELDRAIELVKAHNMEVISIASPLLKCVLPGDHVLDDRFQKDIFGSSATFEDQPRLAERAFEICHRTGAKIIRVFTFWRTMDPVKCYPAIAEALNDLAAKAEKHGIVIGIENEHACNIGTGEETAAILKLATHPNLQVIWDPANALVAGEDPFPCGYKQLPADRIVHVHAKDCRMEGHKPDWGPLGTRDIDWKGQIAALHADGYTGWLSLETHWPGPNGNKFEASVICGWNLRGLASA